MAKGDTLRVWVDVGAGATVDFEVRASKGGRKVRRRAAGKFTYLEELAGRGPNPVVVDSVQVQTQRIVAVSQKLVAITEPKAAAKPRPKRATPLSPAAQMDLAEAAAAAQGIRGSLA